jgi:hypothetical protein
MLCEIAKNPLSKAKGGYSYFPFFSVFSPKSTLSALFSLEEKAFLEERFCDRFHSRALLGQVTRL